MNPVPVTRTPSFSRPLDVATIGDAGLVRTIVADEVERRRLASLDGLVAIENLSADLKIRRDGRWGVVVTGEVKAKIRQICVVTLEEFDAEVLEPVEVRFRPQNEIEAEAARRVRNPAPSGGEDEQEDLPDPIVNGRIDLGVVAAEFLALSLDPYPKKPGSTFVEPKPLADNGAEVSPFAVLGRLKTS